MPTIERTALVPYSAEAMYELVTDVASYPKFLPWCSGAAVKSQSETQQTASVSISAALTQSEFQTLNALEPGQRIVMNLQDGPFKHLTGEWVFKQLGDAGCKVTLSVDFEFSNAMVGRAISPIFTKVCDSLVDAFIKRADVVIGSST